MAETSIEWTATRLPDGRTVPGYTFNPWWGCTKISPACTHCYAADFARRFGVEWGPKARRKFQTDAYWQEPLRWDRQAAKSGVRRKVFCASMADVFEILPDDHPDAAAMDDARRRLWLLIEQTPHLDWLLLTKRPENVRAKVLASWTHEGWPPNVWLGTTIENRATAYARLGHLARIPARVRFLSCEPLLEDIVPALQSITLSVPWAGGQARGGRDYSMAFSFVSWVIAGGESGPGARPANLDWFRSLRNQCRATGTPFFFKQYGEWAPDSPALEARFPGHDNCVVPVDPATAERVRRTNDRLTVEELATAARVRRVGKGNAGRELDGRTWDEYPEGR